MLRAAYRLSGTMLFLALLALLLTPTRAFATPDPSNPNKGKSNCPGESDDDAGPGNGNSNRVHFRFALSGIQTSIWPDGSVALAIPLQNDSSSPAANVKVTDINVESGAVLYPSAFPVGVGQILPDDMQKVDARFRPRGAEKRYEIKLSGTYDIASETCKFHVNGKVTPQPENNDPVKATKGTITKITAETANYPTPPPPGPPDREFNANAILPPMGPPQNFFTSPPGVTTLDRTSAFNLYSARKSNPFDLPGIFAFMPPSPPDPPDPNSVVFIRNTAGANYGGFPPDPSVAGNDQNDVSMFTANTAVFYSTDSGLTFNPMNLVNINDPAIPGRNAFFPQDDGGLCCDQVVHWVPNRNIFVWLLQYWPAVIGQDSSGNNISGPSRLRIAWATPQAIKADFLHAWTWIDLTSADVGIGNDWMDYPDLAYSNNFVYVGVDHGIQNTGQVYGNRHIFARLSLDDMINPNVPYVTYWSMDPTHNGLFQNHIAQSSPDTFYWTAMPDTSTMTVYSWPDSSDTATPHDVKITSYNNSDYSILTPEGIDFSAAPKLTLAATVVDPPVLCPPQGCSSTRFLYFGFSAGRTSGRPYPYVRVEKIDRDTFTRLSELDIWNDQFGFTMPALVWRPGNREDVAVSLAEGGGGSFADNAVGFLGDYVVYVTTDSDTTHAGYNRDKNNNIIYNNGQPTYSVRFGDYYSVRNSIGPNTTNGRGVGYSTLGYAAKTNQNGKKCVDVGCYVVEHYVQFGRFGELIPNPPPPPPR